MKSILTRLFEGDSLNKEEAYQLLISISKEEINPCQIASLLTVYNIRPITVAELDGYRSCLLELMHAIDFDTYETVDLCGTGGDGKHTFNISTLASFIVAGAGYKVAKHGNYGVSSISGSSNVLEALGYKFTNNSDILKKQLEGAGICFMHAPLFHPALKSVGPVRRELGVKTFFNMLGPLVNPSQPRQQLAGVFNLELQELYKHLHIHLDKSYSIVYDLNGYDEISLTGNAKIISNSGTEILSPSHFNAYKISSEDISGGSSVEDSKNIFIRILENKGTEAQNNVVVSNAALAIRCFNPDMPITDAVLEAQESLFSGKALHKLKKLIELQ
jgi:anthranilate phosphoribosyltransferase